MASVPFVTHYPSVLMWLATLLILLSVLTKNIIMDAFRDIYSIEMEHLSSESIDTETLSIGM